MSIFSIQDRQDIMEDIINFTKQNEHITALIAVGSGSYGYNDELSDLDMVIAIDSDDNMNAVKEYISAQLNEKLNIIYFKQAPYAPLQVYVCDNFLEIDIGYGTYTRAAANKAHWKVLFDKSGTVDAAMRSSWDKIKNTPTDDTYSAKLAECADSVWHYLMHAAVAIKRKQYWRVIAELDLARNWLIELYGIRYSLETQRGKDVDKLPQCELSILNKTILTGFTSGEQWNCLAALTDAVFTELERSDNPACRKFTRQQINEYIESCKNL